jgi:protein arginine N-methyltransferase 1
MPEYGLYAYGSMIRDRVRMDAYAKAIALAVKPGSVVLDIGTGTGVLALLAARAGARKVVAVEPSDLIDVARTTAATNELDTIVEFVQGVSGSVELDEPVDVVVSDLRGVLPLYTQHLSAIIDARARLLSDGGVLIPARDVLMACPVDAPEDYSEEVAAWGESPYDLDVSDARPLSANGWWKARGSVTTLARPEQLATLDYRVIESPNVSSSATWTATRAGTLNAFLIWFDTELYDGVGFSNAPDAPKAIYGQALFPVEQPVELAEGDEVTLDFAASLVGGEYVFRWNTRIMDPGGAVKARYTQSTLFSFPLTTDRLRRLEETHKPVVTGSGRALAYLLDRADGERTTRQLADELRKRFPAEFRTPDEAIRFATEQTLKYCR